MPNPVPSDGQGPVTPEVAIRRVIAGSHDWWTAGDLAGLPEIHRSIAFQSPVHVVAGRLRDLHKRGLVERRYRDDPISAFEYRSTERVFPDA